MYVTLPLSPEECINDPFPIVLRNKIIQKAHTIKRKESNLVIDKKLVEKGVKETEAGEENC